MGIFAMIPQLDQCCCGCQLRTGSKFVGWIGAIFGTIAFILYLLIGIGVISDPNEAKDTASAVKTLAIITAVICLLRALFSISLLIGAYKEKISYYLPWLIYAAVSLVLQLIVLITLIAYGADISRILESLSTLCIDVYFVLVVYSDYRQQNGHVRGGH